MALKSLLILSQLALAAALEAGHMEFQPLHSRTCSLGVVWEGEKLKFMKYCKYKRYDIYLNRLIYKFNKV